MNESRPVVKMNELWTVWYTPSDTGKRVKIGTYKTTTAADTALEAIFQNDKITERGIAECGITHGTKI